MHHYVEACGRATICARLRACACVRTHTRAFTQPCHTCERKQTCFSVILSSRLNFSMLVLLAFGS